VIGASAAPITESLGSHRNSSDAGRRFDCINTAL
jgi:hypothetical protein